MLIGLRTACSSHLFPWRSRIWNRMFACSCSIKNYGSLVNGFDSCRPSLALVSQGDAEQVFSAMAASPGKADHLKHCGFAGGQILEHSEARSRHKECVSTMRFTWTPVIYKGGKKKPNQTAELVWRFFKPELIYLAGNVG